MSDGGDKKCPHVTRRRGGFKGVKVECSEAGCDCRDPARLFVCLHCHAVYCVDPTNLAASHCARHIQAYSFHTLYLQCLDLHVFCTDCQDFVYPRELAGTSDHEDALEDTIADWLQVLGNVREWWEDPEIPSKPGCYGLKNFGNTCFFTSVLQCLLHCAPLLKELDQTPDDAPDVQQQLLRLRERYWSDTERDPLVPRSIWRAVAESGLFGVYQDDHMEDSFTLLIDIQDALNEAACRRVFGIPFCKRVRCGACGKAPRREKAAEDKPGDGGAEEPLEADGQQQHLDDDEDEEVVYQNYVSLSVCSEDIKCEVGSKLPDAQDGGEEGGADAAACADGGSAQQPVPMDAEAAVGANGESSSSSSSVGGTVDGGVEDEGQKRLQRLMATMTVHEASHTFSEPLDVESAIGELTKPEPLPDYKCDTCSEVGKCTKESLPKDYPPVLVVQVARFVMLAASNSSGSKTRRSVKHHRRVPVPERLELRTADGRAVQFRLRSFVEHDGGTGGGHYMAYVRQPASGGGGSSSGGGDGLSDDAAQEIMWYSDIFFGPKPITSLDTAEPSILFYERVC